MEKRQPHPINVLLIALSWLMFGAFFIEKNITTKIQLDPSAADFVKGRCKLGKILTIALILLLLIAGVIYLSYGEGKLLSYMIGTGGGLIIAIQLIGILCISSGQVLPDSLLTPHASPRWGIFLAFLPLYSSYLWYQRKQYIKPYRRLKESQLWRWCTMLLLLFAPNGVIAIVCFLPLLFRFLELLLWRDSISLALKQNINSSFLTYPEEIFASLAIKIEKCWKKFRAQPFNEETLLIYQKNYRVPYPSWLAVLLYGTISLLLLAGAYRAVQEQSFWRLIPIGYFLLRAGVLLLTRTPFPKIPLLSDIFINKNKISSLVTNS